MMILKFLRHLLWSYLGQCGLTMVRGNALFALIMLLMANSGTWKYFASTLAAYDFQRAARWQVSEVVPTMPLIIAVDDTGYRDFFDSRSPVSRDRMLNLIQVIDAHTPPQARIAVDIDLSPDGSDAWAQARLDTFLKARPGRWILPAIQRNATASPTQLKSWRDQMCQAGVRFARPYVPTEFGYPKLTQQYARSLGDALAHPGADACLDPDSEAELLPMPLSAASLNANPMIPFNGDLEVLATLLDQMAPQAVILGGMWGHSDLFSTPVGERYGVQVHAAAAAGAWAGLRVAPRIVELGVTWLFIAALALLLSHAWQRMDRLARPPYANMTGHLFFAARGRGICFVLLALICLFLWVELISFWNAYTGYWIATAQVCASTLMFTAITWNFGRVSPDVFHGVAHAWQFMLRDPIRRDLASLRQCLGLLTRRRDQWVDPVGQENLPPLPRWKVFFEALWSCVALVVQMVVPLTSTIYLIRTTLWG
ncbi:MAG: CHASE2 domain-containing protein [Curvibacter sp.]|nr:MAG: CHASE2 domain-containing protein [Curvibacter sp.]